MYDTDGDFGQVRLVYSIFSAGNGESSSLFFECRLAQM